MNRVKDKVAVITGGNSGIGEATARLMASEGAKIIILDIEKQGKDFYALQNELRSQGYDATAIPCDVTKSAVVNEAMAKANDTYGRIDILVCSAGMLDYNRSVDHMTLDLWNTVVALNQSGVFYCNRAALKYMDAQGSGAIVNVSSMASCSYDSGCAYTASKTGVVGLTKNISIRYCGTAIRANVVCPGATITPLISDDSYFQRMDHEFMEITAQHHDNTCGVCEPIDQANAILFLASDEARYISGQSLLVSRGNYC